MRAYSSPDRSTKLDPNTNRKAEPVRARNIDSPTRGVRRDMKLSPASNWIVDKRTKAGVLSDAGTMGVRSLRPMLGFCGI